MALERYATIPVIAELTSRKRKLIDTEIEQNALLFNQKVDYKWLKRDTEKFLRILVGPATFEVVFHADRVELYGTAPAWARLLFTNKHRHEVQRRVHEVLLAAGFIDQPIPVSDQYASADGS